MWIALLTAALAGPVLDPSEIDLLGEPTRHGDGPGEASGFGWRAPILDSTPGTVRVWLHPDAAAARATWDSQTAPLGPDPTPLALPADRAVGDGHARVWMQQGTLVVAVHRPEGEALDLATRLLRGVHDGGDWPTAPRVSRMDGALRVSGSWHEVSWSLPPRIDPETLLPTPRPRVITAEGLLRLPSGADRASVWVWDRYGRGHEVTWRATGAP